MWSNKIVKAKHAICRDRYGYKFVPENKQQHGVIMYIPDGPKLSNDKGQHVGKSGTQNEK